jgi:hypothetical protein
MTAENRVISGAVQDAPRHPGTRLAARPQAHAGTIIRGNKHKLKLTSIPNYNNSDGSLTLLSLIYFLF